MTRPFRLLGFGTALAVLAGLLVLYLTIGQGGAAGWGLSQPQPLPAASPRPNPVAIEAEILTSFALFGDEQKRFGALEWIGGLSLEASSEDFGGFSGLAFLDPNHFLAVSDRGLILTATLTRQDGRPVAIPEAKLGYLPGLMERTAKWKRDAEGLTLAGPEALVSFEGWERVEHYQLAGHAIRQRAPSPKLPRLIAEGTKGNNGLEAVAHAPKASPYAGATILISELIKDGRIQGWIWNNNKVEPFSLPQHGEHVVTDAAFTPGGDLVILERDLSLLGGLSIHLRRIGVEAFKPGDLQAGETLFEGGLSYELDNMEGLNIQPLPDGSSLLSMISDDNFMSFQRTLLLQFRLAP